jgi:integrase
MDVDLSTDLAALLPLVAPLVSGHSDLAVGSRLSRGANVVRGPKREFISRAEAGQIRTRSGTPYKPSALRSYERELRRRVIPVFGEMRLSSLTRNLVQDFADRLVGEGCSPSGVRNAVLPLRAIYRRAFDRGEVDVNPTLKLSLPALRPRKERVPRPSEAAALIAAVPRGDRAIWATALYAGLRRGELQALDWSHVDLEAGVIRVERS